MTTTRCSKWRHPEFRVEYDATIPQADVDTLTFFLEHSVEDGTCYETGHLIQFGSALLKLVDVEGYYELQEPDLSSIPIAWKVGVTDSLKMLRLQKDVADSVGLNEDIDFPSIRQGLLAGVDLTQGATAFVLERSDHSGSDSGWFVGRLDSRRDYNDAANLNRLSVYQAILNWPRIIGFLALPIGSHITISERVEVSRNGEHLEIQKGSLLDVASR